MGVLSMGGVKDWYFHSAHAHRERAYLFVMEFCMILRNISGHALRFHCTLRPHQDYGCIALQQNHSVIQAVMYSMSCTVCLLYES